MGQVADSGKIRSAINIGGVFSAVGMTLRALIVK